MLLIKLKENKNKMKVEKIYITDFYDDENNGLKFGLQEVSACISYTEWFKTEAERENAIKENKFKVTN